MEQQERNGDEILHCSGDTCTRLQSLDAILPEAKEATTTISCHGPFMHIVHTLPHYVFFPLVVYPCGTYETPEQVIKV
jgi:hypothetical protein